MILLLVYGGYFAFREAGKNQGIFVSALIALSIGALMLVILLITLFLKGRKQKEDTVTQIELPGPSKTEESLPPETHTEAIVSDEPKTEDTFEEKEAVDDKSKDEDDDADVGYVEYDYGRPRERTESCSPRYRSVYVSQVGYGPVLEWQGNRVRDMRSNRYYRLEGSYLYAEGSGLSYEISGGRIKTISGNPLFEIHGDHISRVFGGHFASISGNSLSTDDQSARYASSGSLTSLQWLVTVTLLLGNRA